MEDIQPTDVRHSYTILRIKRKRTEEPLDALVVEAKARRKRSKGALNVFKFAETVEESAWDDEQQKRDIEARISSLAREVKNQNAVAASTQPITPSASASSVASTQAVRQPPIDPARSYTVVQSGSQESTRSSSRQPTSPPKIAAYKDLVAQANQPSFTMYDAVPSSSSLAAPEVDPEMDKFLPMLQEYLKVNDISSATPLPSSRSLAGMSAGEDEYVWDVFYQRPTTFQELYEPALQGVNIGTLTGLPPDANAWDSDDSSEFEDEDDEDSNAEDWYTNDYPDEEESSDEASDGDEFHEDSEGEGNYRDDDDLDWR
ncbi:hypothetical protein BXZ70DRAFT_1067833 [Cristinia sonorae]|uniref:Probable RNA polymerase II nuclear localization protein SLC7A6OS n=1 Tax=Cristinia sonorae TaxID=1940300 RepID=A0A8K0UHX5_9AGAR|nr:hypothetical protein BXZ70DRAFT_1067833 [Cristinia sonorae]